MKGLAFIILSIFCFSGCLKKLNAVSYEGVEMDVVANKVDSTINPADDFFDWSNGGWFKALPMPSNESKWGIETMVNEEIYQNMIGVCRRAAISNAPQGTTEQKIGDLWATGMDTMAIEALGIDPIKPELDLIANIKDLKNYFEVVGQLKSYKIHPFFYSYIYQDRMKSDRYSFYLKQGGLGLTDRDYYMIDNENNIAVRKNYVQYIKKLFAYTGESDKRALYHAQVVLKLETYLAEKHLRLENLRGVYKTYNKLAINDLEKIAPSVEWRILFNKLKLTSDSVVVNQPHYIHHIGLGFKKFSLEDWKIYLKFTFLNNVANYLPKCYKTAHFEFFDKTLEGRKVQEPRWKFVLSSIENVLGDGLGRLFVKDFFSESAKLRYTHMVETVRESYAQSIMKAEWMSADTKIKAVEKLKKMRTKIGYPDTWTNFSSMVLERNSYVRNILNANKWWSIHEMSKLSKQVSRDSWNITPQEYNAYYSPANNEIVVSAAMMIIPGYTEEQIDDAVAYGYVAGSTFGHEMTHGFDMDGKEYDINGNLKSWWKSQDSANFTDRAMLLAKQYDQYLVVDTFRCRGLATLDENVADLGGVVIALNAFKNTPQYKEGQKIAGYTPLQRFFMGYALGWMNQYTREKLIRKVMTDIHAPPKLRINGILPNIPEFYEAFNVKPNNKMYIDPSRRVKIW
jgi:putative endopeptidase